MFSVAPAPAVSDPAPGSQQPPLCGNDYVESTAALPIPALPENAHFLDHFLNLLSRSAKLDTPVTETSLAPPLSGPKSYNTTKLFACISFNDIGNIHPTEEKFAVNFRMYLVWTPHPSEGGMEALSQHVAKGKAQPQERAA